MKYSAISSVGRKFKKMASGSNSDRRAASLRLAVDQSGLFDPQFYQKRYAEQLPEGVDPLAHYLEHGTKHGFAPNPWFETEFYLTSNPDVAAAGLNPLLHFAQHGWMELRSPSREAYDFVWHWVMENRTSRGLENPMKRHCAQQRKAPGSASVRALKPLTPEETPVFVEACHTLLSQKELPEGALGAIGRYAVENQLWATAEEAFHALILKRPDILDYRLILADAAEKQGRFWQAADVLADAARHAPGNADLLFRLGEVQEKMGRYTEAASAFERALSIRSEADWHYRHGYALERSGQTAAARAAYNKAQKSGGKLNAARFGIGIFHQSRGLWRDAVSAYEATAALKPADAELWFKLGFAYDRCYEWEKAQHAYAVALSLQFATPYWHYRLGFVLERQEKWREAAGAYRTGADMDAQHRAYWYYRCGYVLEKAGAYEEACSAYLLTGKPYWDTFKVSGAGAYAEWFPRAQENATPLADAVPSLAGGIADTVGAHLEKISSEGRKGVPRQSGHAHTLAKMMEARGDHEAAVQAYRTALYLSPDHKPAWYRDLGALLTRLGRYEEASEAFRHSRILKRPYGVDTAKYETNKETKALMEYCEYLETLPICKDMILYDSFLGGSIGCNPYAIFRHIIDRPEFSGWTHIWAINNPCSIPKEYTHRSNVIFIPRNCDAYRRYLATAEYLINNSTFPHWFIRRDGQKYLNTWHGTPLKAMGKDIKNEFMDYGNITRNFLQATHIISPNQHTSDILMKRHDIDGIYTGKFAETGYPRIDQLVNLEEGRRYSVLRELGLTPDKPVVLYAPTWRGRMSLQKIDRDRLISDVSALISDGYQIVFRGHYFAESALAGLEIPVVVAPHRIDTCDLLSVVDVLVTDYSSILFDFLPARRPIIYYAYDIEEYAKGRGFYFDMADLPGTLCTRIEEVRKAIAEGLGQSVKDDLAYQQALARFCPFEDGSATQRAVDFLFFGSEESVVTRYDDPRQSIVIYNGMLLPNGITSSCLNLLASLEGEDIQVSMLFDPAKIKSDPLRVEKFGALPDYVKCIPHVGAMVMSPEEISIIQRFNSRQLLENKAMWNIYWRGYQREYDRVLGNLKHEAFVNFEGYNALTSALAAAAPAWVQKTIYLHNDMIGERDVRLPYLDKLFQIYDRYDHLVSVSRTMMQVNRGKLCREYGIDSNKFTSCDNTVDISNILSLSQEPLDEDLRHWLGTGKSFVCLGRMSPEKDHAKLLRAFSEVVAQHPDARLVILGDGPLRQELNLLITQLGMGESVKLAGLRMNPFPALKAGDCFILPSNHEGQPMVLLEALVLGKPIIATDIDGNRGLLGDEYGELVENSEAGLRKGMLAFLERGGRPYSFSASEYQSNAIRNFRNVVLPKERSLKDSPKSSCDRSSATVHNRLEVIRMSAKFDGSPSTAAPNVLKNLPIFDSMLENVAKGKRAWQSSTSKWSKPNDAERALNDDGTRHFSFHTDLEDQPWWMVDLGDQYPIHFIVLGNRRNGFQHLSKSIVIELSRDNKSWQCIHKGKLFWRDELTLPLSGEVIARYVRLSLRERAYFHLSKVEVWTRRSSLVVAARRFDGFGSRLQALLNGAYLAKVLNCNFKVTWPDNIIGYAGEFSNDVKSQNGIILGHSIEGISEIFSEAFIRNHRGEHGVSSAAKIATKSNLRSFEIFSGTVNDGSGIINGPMNGLQTSLAPELAPNREYGLPDIFDEMAFSDQMSAAIRAAREVPLPPRTAAVHIRSGDIVYGNYRFHGQRFTRKAVPIPLAKMAIEKLKSDGYDVLLFGEDEKSLRDLRDSHGATVASDMNRELSLSGARRAIFDIVLMSRANTIWGAESGFVQTARDISRTADYVQIHKAFSHEEQAIYFAEDLENSSYDPQQTAFALWSLFWLDKKMNADDRIVLLNRAYSLDPDNKVYLLGVASTMLDNNNDEQGNIVLGKVVDDGWLDKSLWGEKGRIHLLALNYQKRFHLHHFFPSIISASTRGVPNAILAKAILEDAGYTYG